MANKRKIVLAISGLLCLSSIGLFALTWNIEPITLKQQVFTYNLDDNIPTEVSSYAYASDKVLAEAELHLGNVQVGVVDIYDVEIVYRSKTYAFQIQIRDSDAPVAELVQVKWEIKVGDTLVAADMIHNVTETSNYTVYFDGDTPSLEMTFTEAGTYNNIYIFVEDEYGNQSDRLRVSVSVGADSQAPVLRGVDDQAVYVGSYFNPMSGVSAADDVDGDLTDEIEVEGEVDTSTLGTYTLKYTVSDSSGNTTKVVRTITVQDTWVDYDAVPDVAGGISLTSSQSLSRSNYYNTLRISRLNSDDNDENLIALIEYLFDNVAKVEKDDDIYTSSYSVIVDKIGNSEGYARAVKYICDQLEIECCYVSGKKNNSECAWNIIYYNGEYYHLDTYSISSLDDKYFFSDVEMKQLGYEYEGDYPECVTTYKIEK